ncbi:unnamed protein product, partial [Prorocentrum cordatum]
HGPERGNLQKLAILGSFIKSLDIPWAIFADWNVPPSTLMQSGWPTMLGGVPVIPTDVDYTCTIGSGKLYDFIRHPAVTLNEIRAVQGTLSTPLDIMASKKQWREKVWSSRRFDKAKILMAHDKVRQKAKDTDLDPITVVQFRTILQNTSPKKAKGCEALSITDLRRLPDSAIQDLIEIYHQVER